MSKKKWWRSYLSLKKLFCDAFFLFGMCSKINNVASVDYVQQIIKGRIREFLNQAKEKF